MPSERDALNTMQLHAIEALAFVSGMSIVQFRDDRRTFHAVTRCLEIISEASRRLSGELKERHSSLPWRDIADAGNIYRHEYDNVAADFVYKTVTKDLPEILAMLATETLG